MTCPMHAFDPFDKGYLADPYAVYARLHADQPVFFSEELGYWVVSRYDDIKQVLRDAQTYASRNATDPFTPVSAETAAVFRAGGYAMQRVLLNADAPVHPRVRRNVAAAFTPQRVAQLAPRIEALVARTIAPIIALPAREVDIVQALTYALPAEVIFLLIGMDADDVPAIKAGSESRVVFTWGKPTAEQQVALARDMVDFWQRAAAFVAKRVDEPRDDYTSDLIRLRNGDDAVLSLGEITSVVFGLLLAGHETTTGFLTNAIVQLLRDPARWQALAADPTGIPAAIEELLRLDTSVMAMRRVTTVDVTLGGQHIAAGSNILALIGAANHDPSHFVEPGVYDPTRPDARDHLSFGYGAHYCIGAPLARLEAQIVLRQLVQALPTAHVAPDQTMEYLPNTSFRGARSVRIRWQQEGTTMPKPRLTIDGVTYRDLNGNGRLDVYEDPRQPLEARVSDLLGQMTLAEKAGLMFHNFTFMTEEGTILEGQSPWGAPYSTADSVFAKHIVHEALGNMVAPAQMIAWHNAMQQRAEESRLGIPMTFSSDPCHGAGHRDLNNNANNHFSAWPQPIGLGAIGDPALTQQFGDIARQEYRAVGIHMALHPQCDLATEPRWARIVSTFGEDAQASARQTAAYVRGFQGEQIGPHSVLCMTKHFPGGGPQMNGDDAHFHYGREQVYPGGKFDYHLVPFEAAFGAGTAQIMPYYGMPMATAHEEVGFAFNKSVITGLLREKYGFDGVVCTDWGLITDAPVPGGTFWARAWGVEHLSRLERVKKVLEAGCDMFGGEECPELIIELVESGQIAMDRIDVSCRRILRDKFRQGLFDNPYIDAAAALAMVGNAEFRAVGAIAQRRAIVPLHNDRGLLPLRTRVRVYVEGMDTSVVAQYADVVTTPAEADMALVRISTPFYAREGGIFLENMFHTGDLTFTPEALAPMLQLCAAIPTIVDIYLDRPAVIPEIRAAAAALLGNFGASDAALCDIVFGAVAPSGRLPFELPSSMEAVRAQKEDVPYDSVDPLFAYGHAVHWTV